MALIKSSLGKYHDLNDWLLLFLSKLSMRVIIMHEADKGNVFLRILNNNLATLTGSHPGHIYLGPSELYGGAHPE